MLSMMQALAAETRVQEVLLLFGETQQPRVALLAATRRWAFLLKEEPHMQISVTLKVNPEERSTPVISLSDPLWAAASQIPTEKLELVIVQRVGLRLRKQKLNNGSATQVIVLSWRLAGIMVIALQSY